MEFHNDFWDKLGVDEKPCFVVATFVIEQNLVSGNVLDFTIKCDSES